MTILVLGGEGMLGHKVFQMLRQAYPDTACTIRGGLVEPFYSRIDLFRKGTVIERINAMQIQDLIERIRDFKPDVVVNCIGIIKQRNEAKDPIPSITLNALLPHALAHAAKDWGGRIIHFSTDCVFDGQRGGYTEEDLSTAEDLYGKTKFLGEVATNNAVTLRTSIIGRELFNFQSLLEWFLSQAGKTIRGFSKVIYSGVTTNYMAELVRDIVGKNKELHGLFQVVSMPISKFDLLCRLREAYGLTVEIVEDEKPESDRSMKGDKFVAETGYQIPSWNDLISGLVGDDTPYDEWR